MKVLITYYKWLGALLLCVFCLTGEIHAQNMRTSDLGRGDMTGIGDYQNAVGQNPFENPDEDGEGGEVTDTTKVRKPRKPLESWFFDDSTRSMKNFAWNVDMFVNKVHMTVIDTTLADFQVDFPFLKNDVGDAYQGNLGGASVPLSYFRRPNYQDFSFIQPYYAYIYTPENAPHYNVKKPYTRLGYLTAGQKSKAEENFSVIHAQNISPSTGFNVTYNTVGTRGIYKNQRTRNVDFSAGVYHTGKRYSFHAGYINNTLDMRDNGGVVDDWHVTDSLYEDSRTIPMWLTSNTSNTQGARNLLKNNTFYTVHTYGVPLRRLTEEDFSISGVPAFWVGYAFQYDRWIRRYTDLAQYTDPGSYLNSGELQPHFPDETSYYENWYVNAAQTRDSISETRLSNRLFLQLQPWDRDGIVGTVDAGVGVDLHRYHMFLPDDYLTGRAGTDKETSYYVYGSVDGKFRKYFDWNGRAHFVPLGYKQGDLDAEANARLNVYFREHPVSLSGKLRFRRSEPSYWSREYYSNHFKWSNSDLRKENETRLEVKFSIPRFNFDVEFFQTLLGNKVYYKELAGRNIAPLQWTGDPVSVTGLYVRKDFRLGGFHFNNRVLLQWSTNDIVAPVPMASVYLSWYFEFNIVRNVLRAKIGLDGRYNTKYQAYGFNPALGQFYSRYSRTEDDQYGNYPWVDAYAVLKWKRMRIFLKLEHASENLFGTRDYFMIAHYPLNQRIFKLGVSWSFYD